MKQIPVGDRPTLSVGARSPYVKELKELIRARGLWDGSDSEVFGIQTEQAVKAFQAAYYDEKGNPLLTDGEVGAKTWWALLNPTTKAQKSKIVTVENKNWLEFQRRYSKFSPERQAFLAVLYEEYNRRVVENPKGSNRGKRVDLYTEGVGAVPWCALFISWVFYTVTGRYPDNKKQAHVKTGWNLAASKHRTYLKGTRVPTPGDLAVWDFGGGKGHVSAVVAVSASGDQFNTIGGNESDSVKLGLRNLKREPNLVGFIDLFDDSPPSKFLRQLLPVNADTSSMTGGNSR